MAPSLAHALLVSSLLLLSSPVSAARFPRDDLLVARALSVPTDLPGSWSYKGCYSDSTGSRTLTGANSGGATMTGEQCVTFCNGKGYVYAGTEYSQECYCGNAIAAASALKPDADCSMACAGDANQACGGPDRLSLYYSGAPPPAGPATNPGPPGWVSLGCYTDSAARTLTSTGFTLGGPANMSVLNCANACSQGNFKYAGVEYSGECYCGNSLNAGVPAADGCTMVCNGNSTELCGGPNRLNLYQSGTVAATTTTNPDVTPPPVTSSAPNSPAATSTTVKPAVTGLPAGWAYSGCYRDNDVGRNMLNGQPDNAAMTIESCVSACAGLGYSVAGMEYGVQCFCDWYLHNNATKAPEADCNMACGGNSAEKCGAGNRLSVYNSGNLQIIPVPKPQTDDLPGSWKYVGCLSDNVNNLRSLTYQTIYEGNVNNASVCLKLCSDYGYGAGGMEFGKECFCGDAGKIPAANTLVDESECNLPCPGNPAAICGAGNRLTYYTWQGPDLQKWSYPQGNAAGEYSFLIGGVVIPLIVFVGVNGKVTFLEKSGTGAPNTTGAYEFDPSLDNDFNRAYREMHVKTDIFCAAGLTLPDRAGRQLNVGGWAGQSTEGIRLYIPDGSPGVNGTNDWQENVNELALQDGRWYPSAMIMANGSILVVGGEVEQNGAAVPTLELLPKVGGLIYQDWLERTNLLNLYPFLAVTKSGIFVQYYNEARILDENTFQTIKILPNLPGAVNNPAGGRTYPLEGTMMIMPQSPPYRAEDLTVLICGGSIPYNGGMPALDNCVSTQPEAASPKWVLERMPSTRLLTCMVALPDGTYLILNGAHRGEAGFGLAKEPNLNAVLYDPTKPLNQRMSVMANTTIARMYHSEAVLLPDGRVLVTGSNPQDPEFPEEYRVEVFKPPYLLSGLARPTYTITNRDWTYGGQYSITVNIPSGATPKISLIGAEAATHGNTMGQRTFFPATTCSGTRCTITAPPDAHTCPPGWFKLFVLDGPTPSIAQFVRIGGDPGSLGNWPAFDDFDRPGMGGI